MRRNQIRCSVQNLSDLKSVEGAALVLGSAPSLLRVDPYQFDGVVIGVGDLPVRAPGFALYDYWVCANSHFPLPWLRSHRRVMQPAPYSYLVYATSAMDRFSQRRAQRYVDRLERLEVSTSMVVYDQRHRDGLCTPQRGCCVMSRSIVADASIQEQLRQLTGIEYSEGHSVFFHAVALAILLGARPIYIAGVDLPFARSEYTHIPHTTYTPNGSGWQRLRGMGFEIKESIFQAFGRITRSDESVFRDGKVDILNDLSALAKAAKIGGSELVNLSPTSLLSRVDGIRNDFDFIVKKH